MIEYARYTVKVNSGSGCLYRVGDHCFTYVLTARHNLADTMVIERHYLGDNGQPVTIALRMIGVPYPHPDDKKDAALIQVEWIAEAESLARIEDAVAVGGKFTLAGYPYSRAEKPYQFRNDGLIIVGRQAFGYIEAQLDRPTSYNEVIGFSGGGVFLTEGSQVYLAGTQIRMAVDDEKEMLSRIEFVPLHFFDEIAAHYNLVPLIPEHLYCFSRLKDYALLLTGCILEDNVDFTRQYLQSTTDEIVNSGLTPELIKSFFSTRLLIYNQSPLALGQRSLWIAWLEFLIILNIIRDDKVSEQNMKQVFNEFRLIYSATQDEWAGELSNIIRSDFRGMPVNAKIVVATASKATKPIIPAGMIDDIVKGKSSPRSQLQIDEGISNPLVDYKLVHIQAFQLHGIINKEQDYAGYSALNETALLNKLKQEFNALFE